MLCYLRSETTGRKKCTSVSVCVCGGKQEARIQVKGHCFIISTSIEGNFHFSPKIATRFPHYSLLLVGSRASSRLFLVPRKIICVPCANFAAVFHRHTILIPTTVCDDHQFKVKEGRKEGSSSAVAYCCCCANSSLAVGIEEAVSCVRWRRIR